MVDAVNAKINKGIIGKLHKKKGEILISYLNALADDNTDGALALQAQLSNG